MDSIVFLLAGCVYFDIIVCNDFAVRLTCDGDLDDAQQSPSAVVQ